MKKTGFILGMVLLMSGVALAQPGMKNDRSPQGKMDRSEKIAEKLELTPDQVAKFEDMRVAHYKEVQPVQNQLKEKRASLRSLVTADKVDQKKIDQRINEIGKLETALLKAKTNHQIAMRAMLTDKQKMIFDQSHAKMKKGGQGSGRKGGRG
ncbi:MAG: Spy/CpxP family protein refolding chaperone [Cyclobacteriaceae bacterium]